MVRDHWYSGADGGILAVTPDDFRSHGGWAPDRFEAYVSYGNRFSASSGQWSAIIGIRVQTAAFLP